MVFRTANGTHSANPSTQAQPVELVLWIEWGLQLGIDGKLSL